MAAVPRRAASSAHVHHHHGRIVARDARCWRRCRNAPGIRRTSGNTAMSVIGAVGRPAGLARSACKRSRPVSPAPPARAATARQHAHPAQRAPARGRTAGMRMREQAGSMTLKRAARVAASVGIGDADAARRSTIRGRTVQHDQRADAVEQQEVVAQAGSQRSCCGVPSVREPWWRRARTGRAPAHHLTSAAGSRARPAPQQHGDCSSGAFSRANQGFSRSQRQCPGSHAATPRASELDMPARRGDPERVKLWRSPCSGRTREGER